MSRRVGDRHEPPTLEDLISKKNTLRYQHTPYSLENFMIFLKNTHCDENLCFILNTRDFVEASTNTLTNNNNNNNNNNNTTSSSHIGVPRSNSSGESAFSKISTQLFRKSTASSKRRESSLPPQESSSSQPNFGVCKNLKKWNGNCYTKYIAENSPYQCNFPEEIRLKFDRNYQRNEVPELKNIIEARLYIFKTLYNLYKQWCLKVEENYEGLLRKMEQAVEDTSEENDTSEEVEIEQEEEKYIEDDLLQQRMGTQGEQRGKQQQYFHDLEGMQSIVKTDSMTEFANSLANPQQASAIHIPSKTCNNTVAATTSFLDFSQMNDLNLVRKTSPFLFQTKIKSKRVGTGQHGRNLSASSSSGTQNSGSLYANSTPGTIDSVSPVITSNAMNSPISNNSNNIIIINGNAKSSSSNMIIPSPPSPIQYQNTRISVSSSSSSSFYTTS